MVREISLNIDASKANPVADIPTVMLKWTVDIHLLFITKIIDFSFENSCFQDELKLAEVSPIFKNKDDLHKENDRPVSILSHASKVLEKIMYIQIATLMEDILSKLLTGFRKSHSPQHCLMSMLQIWKNTLHKGGYVSAIFINLSKAFETLNHDTLETYGFHRDSIFC